MLYFGSWVGKFTKIAFFVYTYIIYIRNFRIREGEVNYIKIIFRSHIQFAMVLTYSKTKFWHDRISNNS